MYIVGLMFGTFLDGIDAALVHIEGSQEDTKLKRLHFITVPFSKEIKNEIQQALSLM